MIKKYKKEYNANNIGTELLIDLVLKEEKKYLIEKEEIEKFEKKFFSLFPSIKKKKSLLYLFPNNALTYISILSESHMAIHTYTEISLISIDIYFCNTEKNLFNDIKTFIKKWFNPKKLKIQYIKRGID